MNDPKHPAGPAFEKAAAALQAWREQQKAALDERSRAAFERIGEEIEKKKRDAKRRFALERETAVEAEKSKLLLQQPNQALRMLPSRLMRESLAYSKAIDLVRRRHEFELQSLDREKERQEDAFLKAEEIRRAAASRDLGGGGNTKEFRENAHDIGDHTAFPPHTRSRRRNRGDDGRER